jgi:prophage DNA circulation protein
MADLHAAQLDGFALEIETIDDAVEKAIVRHEYPYQNGALLEDMGQKARVVKFRCYFWDDGADHATYDTHTELLKHLDSMDISELVHPKYGPMKGRVESMAVRHDDRDRFAEIDITFVEGLIEDGGDTRHEDVEAGAEEAYNDGIEKQKEEFARDVQDALGPESQSILDRVLDPARGIVEQFGGVTTKARNYLKEVESYVGTMDAAVNTIANPANSLVSTINYGTDLPGRVIGSVSRCVERYALLYDSLKTSPARFVNSMVFGLKGLSNASGKFAKTTTIAAASHTALQTAYLYKADETLRVAQKQREGQRAFDAEGNYTAPATVVGGGNISGGAAATAPETAMTVGELESSLAAVRSGLQEAIDISRQNTSLKQQALQLQTHVNSIKLEREKIIRVLLDNPLPLHLVCLRYGLPYNAAERLLTINAIRNPNCASGEVSVYAS